MSREHDHLTIRNASDFLDINYESTKAIWTLFKKEGRKFSRKGHKGITAIGNNTWTILESRLDTDEYQNVKKFDKASDQLKRYDMETLAYDDDRCLKFSVELLKLKQIQNCRRKKAQNALDFLKKSMEMRMMKSTCTNDGIKEIDKTSSHNKRSDFASEQPSFYFGKKA